MSERSGVEIDYCSQCRGVWLDRGELDKIIERASREMNNYGYDDPRPAYPREEARRYDDDDDYRDRHHPHQRKRESFLGDLFDFG